MIIAGRVIYSQQGWVTAKHDSWCALCGEPTIAGEPIIRVSASTTQTNFAGTCCAALAEERSGHWLLRPDAPRKSA